MAKSRYRSQPLLVRQKKGVPLWALAAAFAPVIGMAAYIVAPAAETQTSKPKPARVASAPAPAVAASPEPAVEAVAEVLVEPAPAALDVQARLSVVASPSRQETAPHEVVQDPTTLEAPAESADDADQPDRDQSA